MPEDLQYERLNVIAFVISDREALGVETLSILAGSANRVGDFVKTAGLFRNVPERTHKGFVGILCLVACHQTVWLSDAVETCKCMLVTSLGSHQTTSI
jgi:hypothetical protein